MHVQLHLTHRLRFVPTHPTQPTQHKVPLQVATVHPVELFLPLTLANHLAVRNEKLSQQSSSVRRRGDQAESGVERKEPAAEGENEGTGEEVGLVTVGRGGEVLELLVLVGEKRFEGQHEVEDRILPVHLSRQE